MAEVGVIRAEWSGWNGGPGLSQFAVVLPDPNTLAAAIAAISSAFSSIAPLIPQGINIAFPGLVEQYESTTGVLLGDTTVTAGTSRTGGGTGPMIAAQGSSITWTTSEIQNGRRVRGRTFIVPLVSSAFDTDGTLSDLGQAYTQQFADGILDYNETAGTSRIAVWGRPREASGGNPARPSSLAPISGARVADKAAVLRSRRD